MNSPDYSTTSTVVLFNPLNAYSNPGLLQTTKTLQDIMLRYDTFPLVALGGLSATAAASTASDKIVGNGTMNKRVYFCQRCLNHGLTEPRKNHKCECAFANCTCEKCILVEKRRVLNTQLHELEEVQEQDIDADSEELNFDGNGGSRVKGERVPNCQKCGQHGRKSRLKGHKRSCPYRDCNCPKCQVVSERQKLMADQIKIRRRQRKDNLMNLNRDNLVRTINAVNAISSATTAGTLPYLNMIYKQLSQVQPPPTSATAFMTSPSPTGSSTTDSISPTQSFSYFTPTPPDMLKMPTPTALSQLPLLFPASGATVAAPVTTVAAPLPAPELLTPASCPSPVSISPTVTVSAAATSALLDSIAAPVAIHPPLPTTTQSQNEQLLNFLTQMGLMDPKRLCMPSFDLLSAVTSAGGLADVVDAAVTTAPSAFVDVCTV